MKNILVFGAGKSATSLIEYLIVQAPKCQWQITVVDADLLLARSKTGNLSFAQAKAFDIRNDEQRNNEISRTDIVISLLPAPLHILVAKDCIRYRKHLVTASYILPEIRLLKKEIEEAGILFMGEMGLDPGIDHMSAMSMLDSIRNKGGEVLSFRGFCGALVSPQSNDNPWQYKIAWNPHAIVTAGMDGAVYREKGQDIHVPYATLFGGYKAVDIPRLGRIAYYPNRDSLDYASLYQLQDVPTILRATLRYPDFCEGWQALVSLGLTDTHIGVDTKQLRYKDWALQAVSGQPGDAEGQLSSWLQVGQEGKIMRQLGYMGLLSADFIPEGPKTNAEVLERIIQDKLGMKSHDQDMIVMMHEVKFVQHHIQTTVKSYLIVVGEDSLHTAIAKTVGLPPGILAKLVLTGKISLRGLHIPVMSEVYKPVLKELEEYGIRFEESFSD